jgi:hypothetical protein
MSGGSTDLIDTPPAPPGGVGAVDASGNVITTPTAGVDATPTAAAADGSTTQAAAAVNAANPGAGLASAPPTGTDLSPAASADLQSQQALSQTGDTSADGLVVGENQVSPPSGTAPAANPVPPLPPGAMATYAPGQAAIPGTAPTVTTETGLGAPSGPSGLSATANPELNTTAGATPASPSGFGEVLSGLQDFTKNNQLLSYGMLQAGGSLLSGLTSTLTPAQVTALNAQAAANNAAAALQTQQTANLAMPKSVASSTPVTGTPGTLVPQQSPGLINNQGQTPVTPVAAPAVTGAPAMA